MKMLRPVFVVCFLCVFSGVFNSSHAHAATLKERLESALTKTEGAMGGVQARSDVVFMISQARQLTGRKASVALDKKIHEQRNSGWVQETEYKLWEARDKKLPRVTVRLPLQADAVLPTPKVALSPDQRFILVLVLMQRAVNCTPSFDIYKDIGEPYFDYVSAHQLLSMMIAGGNGCLSQTAFARSAQPYIQRLYTEMVHHEGALTDLQVERAAFVALAGRVDLVDSKIVDALLDSQNAQGIWVFDMQPEHTSALAYLLLSAVYADKFPSARR